MKMKKGEVLLISFILLFLLALNSAFFQYYWFVFLKEGEVEMLDISIKLEEGWYPVLNSEKDYVVKIREFFTDKKAKYPTVGYDYIKCNENDVCKMDIDFMPQGFKAKIVDKIISSKILNTDWGNVKLIKSWESDNAEKYMYFNEKFNIVLTTSKPEYVRSIKSIRGKGDR